MAVHPRTARTVGELASRSAERYAARPAARFKSDGEWREYSYAELGSTVEELALGLLDLGIEPGERVCILANTRPEWSAISFAIAAAGCVVVPIYPTSSPEECAWVAGNSGARAVVVEDAGQLAKIERVRERLPGSSTRSASRRAWRSWTSTASGHGAAPRATESSCAAARRPSWRTTPTRSSTPRAPPGRPRAHAHRTASLAWTAIVHGSSRVRQRRCGALVPAAGAHRRAGLTPVLGPSTAGVLVYFGVAREGDPGNLEEVLPTVLLRRCHASSRSSCARRRQARGRLRG